MGGYIMKIDVDENPERRLHEGRGDRPGDGRRRRRTPPFVWRTPRSPRALSSAAEIIFFIHSFIAHFQAPHSLIFSATCRRRHAANESPFPCASGRTLPCEPAFAGDAVQLEGASSRMSRDLRFFLIKHPCVL